MNRTEYFQKQKELTRAAYRCEVDAIRRIRACTRELVLPLVRQYMEQGMIVFPKEELSRRIDHIIREEGAKPVQAARKVQEEMEASLAEKLGIVLPLRPESKQNTRMRQRNAGRQPIGATTKITGRAWAYGTQGVSAYYRDPQTGKIVWTDIPLEYKFRKRADLSTLVWSAVEEQEQMVLDVVRGGRAAGRNVKDIAKDLETFINYGDGGKRVVGRWMGMFPNTKKGRREAWKREYLKDHGGLQPRSDAAKELLREPDAREWVKQKMAETTKRGTPRLPDAVKQYAVRLGKAGLDYRAIRIARTETTAMLADEQTDIARNSAICDGTMDFVMERGRDHWNCFDKSAKVLTVNGWKKIHEINVGEYVIAASGKIRRVVSVMSFENNSPLNVFDGIMFTQDQKILSSSGFYTLNQCNDLLNIDVKSIFSQISKMNMEQFPPKRCDEIPFCIIHITNFNPLMRLLYIDLNGNFKLWEGNIDIEFINGIIKNGGIPALDKFLINSGFILRARLPLPSKCSFAKSVMFFWLTSKAFFSGNMSIGHITDPALSIRTHNTFSGIRYGKTTFLNYFFNYITRYVQFFMYGIDRIVTFIKQSQNFIFVFIAFYCMTINYRKTMTYQNIAYNRIMNTIIRRNMGGRNFAVGKPVNNISDYFRGKLHKNIIFTNTVKVKKKKNIKTVFDLEVEEEHNFIVKGKSGAYIFHNCNCEEYAKKTWKVDDPNRPEIPVHPNCMCQWRPRLKTNEEILKKFREKWGDSGDTGATSTAGETPAADGGSEQPPGSGDDDEERKKNFEELIRENSRRSKETADYLHPDENWQTKTEWGERIFVSSRRAMGKKSNFDEEMHDAMILRDLGGTVYLNPEDSGLAGKKSDAILNGETIEFKNVRGNANTLIKQFYISRSQSPNVFINLEKSNLTESDVISALYGARNSVTHSDKDGHIIKGYDDRNAFTGGRVILKIRGRKDLLYFDVENFKK